MASNFKIHSEDRADGLHLELAGDFDGTSALKLFNILSIYVNYVERIFLHTEGLEEVYGLGEALFQNACTDLHEIRKGTTDLIISGGKVSLRQFCHTPTRGGSL